MSDRKGSHTKTIARTQKSDQPGVGIIATAENSDLVARTILRAHNQDHHVLVASADGPNIEAIDFAKQLGSTVVYADSTKSKGELEQELENEAKSLGLPGLISHTESTSRIDFDQTKSELNEGGFSIEAEAIEAPDSESQVRSAGQSIAAIIPAYNEAETLPEIVSATAPYVDDVIVINDASTDNTGDVARKHADEVVSLPKNMGVGGAVYTGYQAAIRADYDIVIQIDGDGQHDPSYIPEMLETLDNQDADMVIGSRWLNDSYQNYSLVRRSGIKFFTAEVNFLGGLDITDVTSGFRAYRTTMLENLGRPENSHWALEQTLEAARKDYTIEEVSVPMPPATDGSQFDIGTFVKYPPRMMLTTLKTILFR